MRAAVARPVTQLLDDLQAGPGSGELLYLVPPLVDDHRRQARLRQEGLQQSLQVVGCFPPP